MSVQTVIKQLQAMQAATERKFAIVSDILGLREDIPSIRLPSVLSPESLNVMLRHGCVERIKGRSKQFLDAQGDPFQTPDDGSPIIKYHQHLTAEGLEYAFACTKRHIYLWDQTGGQLMEKFECSEDCEHWSLASANGKVIATNWVDYVQVWSDGSPSDRFEDLGEDGLDLDGGDTFLTAAKYVVAFEGYMIFLYTMEGGKTYPHRVRHSSFNDETDYDRTGTGDANYFDLPGDDYITGVAVSGPQQRDLIIFKSASHHHYWLTDSVEVFKGKRLNDKIGLLAPDAVATDGEGKVYYLASNRTIRVVAGGEVSQAVDKTLKDINVLLYKGACAGFIAEYEHIVFALPIGVNAGGNNQILCYQAREKVWQKFAMPVTAFASFVLPESYTIDTIPFDTIDSIGWRTIDTVEGLERYPIDLVGDEDGYTWHFYGALTDAGQEFNAHFVLSTDMAESQALSEYKRINKGRFFFTNEASGEVGVSVRAETDQNWQQIGIISVSDGTSRKTIIADLPMDLRARKMELKFQASCRFRFIGVILSYEIDGDL